MPVGYGTAAAVLNPHQLSMSTGHVLNSPDYRLSGTVGLMLAYSALPTDQLDSRQSDLPVTYTMQPITKALQRVLRSAFPGEWRREDIEQTAPRNTTG
eukprot:3809334-Amphidinium_carterae.1